MIKKRAALGSSPVIHSGVTRGLSQGEVSEKNKPSLVLECSAQQYTNGAWCSRRTAALEQRSKRPITY